MKNNKLIIIIVGFVVLLILAGLALWYFNKQSGQVQTSTGSSTSEGHGGFAQAFGNLFPFLL